MKKSILTMFLIVLISPLSSAMASGIALCSGGAANSTYQFIQKAVVAPSPAGVCEDACSAQFVGCKNTAKETTKCVFGGIDDVVGQLEVDCDNSGDPVACKAYIQDHADYKRMYAQEDRNDADEYCADQYAVCLSTCI